MQQASIKFVMGSTEILITVVYTRCNRVKRLELWDSLELLSNITCLWLVGGDFNIICNDEKKFGGLEFDQIEAIDFNQCISNYALTEIRCTGSQFTWWNGCIEDQCIFERLDRVFYNQEFGVLAPNCLVTHLIRQGSNYAPLHLGIFFIKLKSWKIKSSC